MRLPALVAATAALALIGAVPAAASPDPVAAAPSATYSDGLIHVFGTPAEPGSRYSRVNLVAGSALPSFGDEETLVVEINGDAVIVEVLDGRPLLMPEASDGNLPCASFDLKEPSAKVLCLYMGVAWRTPTVIDLSAATGATQTVARVGTNDYVDQEAIDFRGGSGPDYFEGGRGPDLIEGNGGDDDLFGGDGRDTIGGGPGNDTIYGEKGQDTLNGGSGDDYVSGDEDADWIIGGSGVDEIDAEDGLKDTRVDCENEPGKGAVQFDYVDGVVAPDNYLDVPFNCPVLLTPSAPASIEATGGKDTISASWSVPEFNGNSEQLTYEFAYRKISGAFGPWGFFSNGADTGVVLGPFEPGIYEVKVRASNEVGTSEYSASQEVVVGFVAAPPTDVVSNFYGDFTGAVNWTAAVPPGDPGATVAYQVALRVKDKKNKKWQKWTTFPDTVSKTSYDLSGSLKLIQGRVYQARVRTQTTDSDGFEKYSDWVNAQERYAGNLPAPKITNWRLTGIGSSARTEVTWKFTGLAWQLNGFDVVSPARMKTGFGGADGPVTYNRSQDQFRGAFPTGGTNKYPDCTLRVWYYRTGGSEIMTSAPFTCYRKR